MKVFSERLREIMHERKMTQQELSEKISVGYTEISMFETGKKEPSLSTLTAIAEVLDITVLYLLGITEQKYPASFGKENVFSMDFSNIDQNRLMNDIKEFERYLEQKENKQP